MKSIKTYICILSLLFWVTPSIAQNYKDNASINNIDFGLDQGKLWISYNLNCNEKDVYDISVTLWPKNGPAVHPRSLTGHLEAVTCGTGKYIVWDVWEDDVVIRDYVEVMINRKKHLNIDETAQLFKSAVMPGLGQYRLSNNKYEILNGVAAYGAIGASVYYNSAAASTYNSYLESYHISNRAALLQTSRNQVIASLSFAGVAAAIWLIDLYRVHQRTQKLRNLPEVPRWESEYYYTQTHYPYTTTSAKLEFLDTRTEFQKTLDKGWAYYDNENFEAAKWELLHALNIEPLNAEALGLFKMVQRALAEIEERNKAYTALMAEGEMLIGRCVDIQVTEVNGVPCVTKLKEARNKFREAEKLMAKESKPGSRIQWIDERLDEIEKNEKYSRSVAAGDAAFAQKQYDIARGYYEEARFTKPNEAYPPRKLNEIAAIMESIAAAKREREYKGLTTKADAALAQQKYAVAKGLYEDAMAVDPSKSYPLSQIDKINAIASNYPNGKFGNKWENLYSNNNITVKIDFLIRYNGCNIIGKKNTSKFKYKVTGSAYWLPNSLSWQLDYVDCNGRIKTETFYLDKDLMRKSILQQSDIRDMDYNFICNTLKGKFYNVRTH